MCSHRYLRIRALDLLGRPCVSPPPPIAHSCIKTDKGPHSLGAILAVAFYRFIKILEYENANPGQDHNEHDEKAARRSIEKETV